MNKNIINCKHGEFIPGRTLRATVKTVNKTGVMVKTPGGRGSGVISARCWGDGLEREKALAAIRSGDEFDVVVRSYDQRTLTLSLVLVECESLMVPTKKPKKSICSPIDSSLCVMHPRKPAYQPIESGTVFLWDTANLLGATGAENAAQTFKTIAQTLTGQGYKALFFIERRCLTWALCNQRTEDEVAELDAFVRQGDVVVVEDGGNGAGEADYAILQMAEALPGSVCVTRDHHEDYAHVYPNIVGTNRIRSFSVAKACGKTMILVNGITHAIVVVDRQVQAVALPVAPSAPSTPVSNLVPADSRRGLLAVAGDCVRRGDVQRAERIYAKVAKRDPAAYRALAEMYREGKAVPVDGKKAARYERLARKSEKSRRARSMRERRLRAEAIRSYRHTIDHFAAKRREALNLAICGERCEMAHEHRKLMRTWRRGRGVRAHAA